MTVAWLMYCGAWLDYAAEKVRSVEARKKVVTHVSTGVRV